MIAQAADTIPVSLPTFWTVITALCGVITAFGKYAYDRFNKCEQWRDANEPIIRELMKRAGMAEGINEMVNECPIQGCPWKGKLEAYSVSEEQKNRPS